MNARRVRSHARRLGVLSALLIFSLPGCGDSTPAPGQATSDNPKAGPRRKEMSNFMKDQPNGTAPK